MTLKEYIEEYYPIRDRVEMLTQDLAERVKNNDSLPCDEILFINGKLQKVVYLDTEEPVPVVDLISYTKEEVDSMTDRAFADLYYTYMENIIMEQFDFEQIIGLARQYRENQDKHKQVLS